ncbi:Protoporphyrinogen oxidase [Rickenella mellea]|uniref:Protoporphyrinogen oxidase n=1 Tax=Rickenella mellea TaxID=50990 RepID=A0A4Y7QC46_9AGAM|nr:Protoporphyrinogen oxidase [Rickenella mellea]
MVPSHIAVLGGGITGLSAAYHLARRFPSSRITLLEKERRLGGWLRSERVEVTHGADRADVLLESGPRTLRPNSKALLELIHLLGLRDSLITTPVTSPAATRRFLHIPGTKGLTALPSSPRSLFTSPLARLLIPSILREPWIKPNRPHDADDESFDAFVSRRFGNEVARVFGSALVHGIYAADSRELSVRAAFPTLWEAEERGKGSVLKGFLKRRKDVRSKEGDDYELGDVVVAMKGVSVYSFRDGIETLATRLAKALHHASNVTVRTTQQVTGLCFVHGSSDIDISLSSSQPPLRASHIVSTLPLPTLSTLLPSSHILPHLTATKPSSVVVINIIFPPTSTPIHPPGFGYLVPRPVEGYTEENEGVLGTVFDSAALDAQDVYYHSSRTGRGSQEQSGGRFTKLTMMLGGPHTHILNNTSQSTTPSRMLPLLASHLGIPLSSLPPPLHFRVTLQKDCIPAPRVGHVRRMEELKDALKRGPWNGRVEVVGAGVGGVSVGDCVRAGREAGRGW